MKMRSTYIVLLIGALSFSFISFSTVKLKKDSAGKEMPENVKAAIDKSCYGCHNSDTGGTKPTEKLDFKGLNALSRTQKIAKLSDISEVIKKGEMPPKKFIEKNPGKALTKDDKKLITKWVSEEIKDLMKK